MAAVFDDFIMQVRASRAPRGADQANTLFLRDVLALFDQYFAQVGIASAIPFGVLYFYEQTISALAAGVGNGADCCSVDGSARRGGIIRSKMGYGALEYGVETAQVEVGIDAAKRQRIKQEHAR